MGRGRILLVTFGVEPGNYFRLPPGGNGLDEGKAGFGDHGLLIGVTRLKVEFVHHVKARFAAGLAGNAADFAFL